MTQPCRNFKTCRGLAHSRHAKHCARCWRKMLELQRMKTPLKDIKVADGYIEFEFDNTKGLAKEGDSNAK